MKDFKQMFLDKYVNPKEEVVTDYPYEKRKKTINYYLNKEGGEEQMLEAIHEIMDYFDFEKIHDVMEYMDWQWRDNGVPTIEMIKEELLDRLTTMFEEGSKEDAEEWSSSCAGFNVEYRIYEPHEDEPDDFKHCVSVYAAFTLEDFCTTW